MLLETISSERIGDGADNGEYKKCKEHCPAENKGESIILIVGPDPVDFNNAQCSCKDNQNTAGIDKFQKTGFHRIRQHIGAHHDVGNSAEKGCRNQAQRVDPVIGTDKQGNKNPIFSIKKKIFQLIYYPR